MFLAILLANAHIVADKIKIESRNYLYLSIGNLEQLPKTGNLCQV